VGDLSQHLLIDNSPHAPMQLENAVLVSTFINDANDIEARLTLTRRLAGHLLPPQR